MNQRIVIPDTDMFAPLVERIDTVAAEHGFSILRAPEQQCADLLWRNSAELALLTPLGYAQGVGRADYRIVRGPVCVHQGLTYAASIYIRNNAELLEKGVSTHAGDFAMRVGAMVFSEKFGVPLTIASSTALSVSELLREYEVVIDWGFDAEQKVVLDVSDEWNDLTGLPLPMAMWVCRPDDMPENLEEIIAAFAAPNLQIQRVVEQTHHNANAEREGSITWEWTETIEPALQRLFEMMFFLQHIPEIPALKLWGRDIVE